MPGRPGNQATPAPGLPLPGEVGAGDGTATAAVAAACSRCGGPLISGTFVLPILGRAKYAYNLRGRSIETDVDAQMCSDCGLLTFTAQDPQRIRRAYDADRFAEAAVDGTARRARPGPASRGTP